MTKSIPDDNVRDLPVVKNLEALLPLPTLADLSPDELTYLDGPEAPAPDTARAAREALKEAADAAD